jgi:hypothetical protein
MQQIADWLEKLGMSEYAQRFAENRIDFSVLRDLTDQDLKDLGIVLGDRRKLLRRSANSTRPRRRRPVPRRYPLRRLRRKLPHRPLKPPPASAGTSR